MARDCAICHSGKASEIDAAILSGEVQQSIIRRFRLSTAQLRAHACHIQPPKDYAFENGVDNESAKNFSAPLEESESTPAESNGVEIELSDTLGELMAQRKRLLADIAKSNQEGRRDHALRSETALLRNIEIESKLNAEEFDKQLEAMVSARIKPQISSLARFFINQLAEWPEVQTRITAQIIKEFGLSENWTSNH